MLELEQLRRDIETALASPKADDPVLAAKRQLGVRFIVDVRKGQSQSDVEAAFKVLSDHFEVEPLFPSPPFEAPGPDAEPTWRELAFVAAIHGAAFDDVSAHPWDLAHAAREQGGFLRVAPDVPSGREEPPAEPKAEIANHPGPGWEHVTMRLKEAWDEMRRNGRTLLGDNVHIGHPDTGWTAHPVWGRDQPNLDKARAWNFIPGETPPNDARDRLIGGVTLQPGHGTHTSAVMVAPTGGPVVGVAPNAMVVPIRCITSVILIGQIEVVRAIDYARMINCRVISLSLGGWEIGMHPHMRGAIRSAIGRNIIVLAAAGQSPWGLPGAATVYPAAYPECIAVAGVEGVNGTPDPRDGYKPWNSSNRSNPNGQYGRITISAPACPVYTALANRENKPTYGNSEGTSFATAFMAGAAALWLSYHFFWAYEGRKTAQEQFREYVQKTARKPRGFDPWFYGMVDIEALIKTKPAPEPAEAPMEEAPDLSVAAEIAGMLGCAQSERVKELLAQALLGLEDLPAEEAADSAEGLILEIGYILHADQELRSRLAEKMASSSLTPAGLAELMAPAASSALRDRLAGVTATLEPAGA